MKNVTPKKPSAPIFKAAIYARVSTTDQNCEMQLQELREYCARRGWAVTGEYVDTGWSGTKARRPQLDRLMKDASEHRFDVITVWKLDRFGRSVLNLVEALNQLSAYGVRFVAATQGIDTDQANPTSKLILWILAAVAEFEREMIRERVSAGQAEYRRAMKSGAIGKTRHSKSGKDLPPHRPRKVFPRAEAAKLRAAGHSWNEISKRLKVSKSTLRDALKSAA